MQMTHETENQKHRSSSIGILVLFRRHNEKNVIQQVAESSEQRTTVKHVYFASIKFSRFK